MLVPDLQVILRKGGSKWQLILDVSSAVDQSFIDGIQPDIYSLLYVSVDDAVIAITVAGQGGFVAKVDLKSAYHLVPIHPEDRLLMWMSWEGEVYVDTVLPFSPADALEYR